MNSSEHTKRNLIYHLPSATSFFKYFSIFIVVYSSIYLKDLVSYTKYFELFHDFY